jgi:poly(hydroxyalkanoate) depolymerase family esterase
MRRLRLGRILRELADYRSHWEDLMKSSGGAQTSFEPPSSIPDRLREVTSFGPNPGNLRMFTYVPERVSPSPALVVVLHGCTQTAAGYDHGAGWSTLADRYGFVLVFPEQQEANNLKRCFNWFQPEDTRRGHGEAASIRQMVDCALKDNAADPARVFVTGLSAGGAMASTMLAAYPDVFAAGAIIAGLPHGCASSVSEAFECMFQGKALSAEEWGALVHGASQHRGPWPKVSVWHGTADATVRPMNAGEIIKQWTNVHGLAASPNRTDSVNGYPHRVWSNAAGEDVIEEYVITGMAHGTPLAVSGDSSCGIAGPFLLDAGISSSDHIAAFWGLAEKPVEAAPVEPEIVISRRGSTDTMARDHASTDPGPEQQVEKPRLPVDVGSTIAKALRAAGLMK